jgi:hypothetical protein
MPISKKSGEVVARDVFLYFLMIFVLASSAIALGTIAFTVIDHYLPVTGAGYYYGYDSVSNMLKFPVASLIIMFPALVWVIRFLNRDMAAQPAKRDLKIRKWLLYLALFVAGLIMLGDLVALVWGLLDGNTAIRFLLKVATVLWLSGSVFYYFLKDLHNEAPAGRKVVAWTTIVLAVAALAVSLFLIGSPATQRARNNDSQRVNNLQMLESQVVSYWQTKGRLPDQLTDLADGTISGSLPVPTDPVTHNVYGYQRTGDRSYRFCADFQTASEDGGKSIVERPYGGTNISTWDHSAGRTCFDGIIDPDRYPPIKR